MRRGGGRRQQLILRLLADGTPRDCATIARETDIPLVGVQQVIGRMEKHRWVRVAGRNDRYGARRWQLTKGGHAVCAQHAGGPSAEIGK
ncbi:hypothetical protein [Nocardia sp. BMG51109]|uniref:hypothetical protein n=1 Tax=Nocardia sp. BMG51109 TaxID=1056816 RepID=UPI0004649BB2|nr:hypothetical protein [Nocardia sp. BMG51109]